MSTAIEAPGVAGTGPVVAIGASAGATTMVSRSARPNRRRIGWVSSLITALMLMTRRPGIVTGLRVWSVVVTRCAAIRSRDAGDGHPTDQGSGGHRASGL